MQKIISFRFNLVFKFKVDASEKQAIIETTLQVVAVF